MLTKPIWIIAHGSSNPQWIDKVNFIMDKVKMKFTAPIIVSFLENVGGRSIEEGRKDLLSIDAKQVMVIPLFVSSGSNHIVEIKEKLLAYKEFDFIYSECMDNHPLVVQHIVKMASEVASEANLENLLLIGHGSDKQEGQQKWKGMLEKLVREVSSLTNFKQVAYATYYPYTIDAELKSLGNDHTIIVVPLFLSRGYFTNIRIPELIKDYQVKYNNKAYLDEEWIVDWIEDQITINR